MIKLSNVLFSAEVIDDSLVIKPESDSLKHIAKQPDGNQLLLPNNFGAFIELTINGKIPENFTDFNLRRITKILVEVQKGTIKIRQIATG